LTPRSGDLSLGTVYPDSPESTVGWTHDRARVAALKRHRVPDDPEVTSAVRDLSVTLLAEHVRRVVDAAPPLTADQRARLAALLRPVQDGGAQR
jgi:hypothetical protein